MRACFGRSRGGNIAIAEDGGHYSSVTEYLIVDTMGVTGFGNALDTPRMMAPGSDDGDGASPSGGDSYPEQKLNDFQWHAKWADMTAEQQVAGEIIHQRASNLLLPERRKVVEPD